MNNKREILPDIIKGFAILLVIFGHCIQEGNGLDFSYNMLFYDDKIYQFIYSFHMPLFALLAGYFSYPSITKAITNKDKWFLLLKRIITYFIPISVWTLLEYIRECVLYSYYGLNDYSLLSLIQGYFIKLINNHWFLWSMIFSFIVLWIMHYICKDNPIIYTLLFISLFFITDNCNFHTYKYLLPFYILAFYVNQYGLINRFSSKINLLLIISFFVFIFLFLFYRKEALIYVSGYRIISSIWWKLIILDLYRFIIGLIGSSFFILLFMKIKSLLPNYEFPILSLFGKYTLGIYLISGYSTILIMRKITDSLSYSIPRVILETIIISIVSLILSIIISKIPYVKKIVGK